MGISQSESGKFSFRFWGFSIDKTQLTPHFYIWISANRGAYLWVSMPSRAWVVTWFRSSLQSILLMFQCPHGLELLRMISTLRSGVWRFNALTGLSCYALVVTFIYREQLFQCPHGLELLPTKSQSLIRWLLFQCPHGLELLHYLLLHRVCFWRFNALTGLSCYSKNVQYFKFFMILFMHTCYL